MARDRTDFRLNRLERRVFGTQTPTAGTNAGTQVLTNDLITRIVDLENQLAAVGTPTSGAGDPITLGLSGAFGARYFDTTTGFWWVKGPTQWQQQP